MQQGVLGPEFYPQRCSFPAVFPDECHEMGCNSSKESGPQNEADDNNKENEEKSEDNGKVPNEETAVENHLTDSARSDTKSSSAKTITLRSNGTAKSIEEPRDPATGETVAGLKIADEAEAATKIQAAFRGHKTRKSMKQPERNEEREPTREELENEFRLDDPELCHAATKIQASFRGHMSRKQVDKKGDVSSSSKEDKVNQDDAEDIDNIDLTDPELNKAAAKIQASFRGHMTRKELPDEVKSASK